LAVETKRMPLASKIVKITDSPELRPSRPTPDPNMLPVLPVLAWVVWVV
jgi:hypothetical protein